MTGFKTGALNGGPPVRCLDGVATNHNVTVLLLPGWRSGEPDHWLGRWALLHGYQMVEQDDRLRPRRGDWLARLDEVVIDAKGPVVLVAHNLACILVAAWARFSRHTDKVQAALLVAPSDVASPALQAALPGWWPVERRPLPFRSMVVGCGADNDGCLGRAQQLACDWSAHWHGLGRTASASTLADDHTVDWPEGHGLLQKLLKD